MYFQAKGKGEISVYEVSKLKKVDRIRNDRSPRKVGKNNEKNSKKINIQTFSPIPLNKEIHSSKFKRNSKTGRLQKPETMLDIQNVKDPAQILTKKSTMNISDCKSNSYEERIFKNMEIGTAILKNMPLSEAGSARERSNEKLFPTRYPLSEAYKNRSGDTLPTNLLAVSSVQPNFKSPQLSPVMESRLQERKKASFRGGNPSLNMKNLYASLSLNPFKIGEEEIHSALGQSITRIGRQIKEVDEHSENDDKFNFVSLERSVMEEPAEEEIKEQELYPDERDLKDRGAMKNSWDCHIFEKAALYKEGAEEKIIKKEIDEKNTLKPGKFFLLSGKRGNEAVESFYEILFINYKKENYLMLAVLLILYLYELFIDIWRNKMNFWQFHLIAKMCFVFVHVLIIKYLVKLFEKQRLKKILFALYFAVLLIVFWPQITQSRDINLTDMAKLILIKLSFQNISIILFSDCVILNIILLAFLIIFRLVTIHQFLILFFYMTVHLYCIRENFLREISKHNLAIANALKKSQQKNLVRNLLPVHITQQFINKPSAKSELIEEFKDVTIIFADIKGFTDFSAHNPAPVVVNMLRDLFTEFDKLCLQNDVYKLYTIGDCYVALGLVDANERNIEEEARNVLQFAFGMINAIKSVRKKNPELEMRIGIHIV